MNVDGSNSVLMSPIGPHTTGTSFSGWGTPVRVDVLEYSDRIEFVYKETSMITFTSYPPLPPQERVFKIVFSCEYGQWHKSEPIYGKILSAVGERYQF